MLLGKIQSLTFSLILQLLYYYQLISSPGDRLLSESRPIPSSRCLYVTTNDKSTSRHNIRIEIYDS